MIFENDIVIDQIPDAPPEADTYKASEVRLNLSFGQAKAVIAFMVSAFKPGFLTVKRFGAKARGTNIYVTSEVAEELFGNQPIHYVAVIQFDNGTGEQVVDLGYAYSRITNTAKEDATSSVVGVLQGWLGFGQYGQAMLTREQLICMLTGIDAALIAICRDHQNALRAAR